MGDESRVYGGRWHVIREIGKGGHGVVYEVADMLGQPSPHDLATMLALGLRDAEPEIHMVSPDPQSLGKLVEAIRKVVDVPNVPRAALKELLPIDAAVNATTAIERMTMEIGTLKSVAHPALIKVLDDKLDDRWFVTEYFKSGTLVGQLERYKGHVLEALLAFRPIVDATAVLHRNSIVHRDIKPDNVFVADDGHLVLGDCGLAIKLENQERITLTYENVGTRDYQPAWSYGMRLQDVKPNFDVFSLGKLLWAMVSGKPRFPLWYFDRNPHDLRTLLPDNPDVLFVQRILKQCVVEHSEHCILADASALLAEVDKSIQALSTGAVVPTTTGRMRCRFCGVGSYNKAEEFAVSGNSQSGSPRHYYCCDHCGHLEFFVYLGSRTPPAWTES